jgi:hypothetical protein
MQYTKQKKAADQTKALTAILSRNELAGALGEEQVFELAGNNGGYEPEPVLGWARAAASTVCHRVQATFATEKDPLPDVVASACGLTFARQQPLQATRPKNARICVQCELADSF